eukprot:130795-Chlamydomonas_euryale.AAC.1
MGGLLSAGLPAVGRSNFCRRVEVFARMGLHAVGRARFLSACLTSAAKLPIRRALFPPPQFCRFCPPRWLKPRLEACQASRLNYNMMPQDSNACPTRPLPSDLPRPPSPMPTSTPPVLHLPASTSIHLSR